MLAIKTSVDNRFYAAGKAGLIAGPMVTCPTCGVSFNLYTRRDLTRVAEQMLVEYLRQHCPRHVECFGGDEKRNFAGSRCPQCIQAYEVLGLCHGEAKKQIRTAYRELAKKWHPDRFGDVEEQQRHEAENQFRVVCNAYKHLLSHG